MAHNKTDKRHNDAVYNIFDSGMEIDLRQLNLKFINLKIGEH